MLFRFSQTIRNTKNIAGLYSAIELKKESVAAFVGNALCRIWPLFGRFKVFVMYPLLHYLLSVSSRKTE